MLNARIITKAEFLAYKEEFVRKMKGGLFIYPTDTIYGLGCDATNEKLVKKIHTVKKRERPLSIIAPSIDWIYQNCHVDEDQKIIIEQKLPGPYTIILNLKNKNSLSEAINVGNPGTIGVRIPEHWFSEIVEEIGFPIVTTSANVTGKDFMTSVSDLSEEIGNHAEFVIHVGEKKAKPSTIIDLTSEKISVKER